MFIIGNFLDPLLLTCRLIEDNNRDDLHHFSRNIFYSLLLWRFSLRTLEHIGQIIIIIKGILCFLRDK